MALEADSRNPVKGKGERYIYCPDDSGCLNHAALKGWRAFHCEQCLVYIKSDSYQMKKQVQPQQKQKEVSYMSDDKNQLIGLNDSLFRQLDRLTKDDLEVAAGMYIYHLRADDTGDEIMGKFAIIK